jgi:hypothetical protein
MLYHVYKLQMSDAARDALNSAGSWDAHPESKVYANCATACAAAMPCPTA